MVLNGLLLMLVSNFCLSLLVWLPGMSKVKFGKEEERSREFVDKRKALLDRLGYYILGFVLLIEK